MKTQPPSDGLSRRNFLRLAGLHLGALALLPFNLASQPGNLLPQPGDWPRLQLTDLPVNLADILFRVPALAINPDGVLGIQDIETGELMPVPLARTEWNLEFSRHADRFDKNFSWGIVLHWFGDLPGQSQTIKQYLNGFNSVRRGSEEVNGMEFSTSAHFLVGDGLPSSLPSGSPIGIVQTQAPDVDGVPFIASHMRGLSFGKHEKHEQYFVKAYYQLAYAEPAIHSLLQDLYDGRWIHPNSRTFAIEITGTDFDRNFPSVQKIANVLGVVRAIMLRYNIPANRLLGHHEMQMNKGDPGKQFMAFMRFVLGVLALADDDPRFRRLVLGPLLPASHNPAQAVNKYFKFVRDYHGLVSKPIQVFEWEKLSQYWQVERLLPGSQAVIKQTSRFLPPIEGEYIVNGFQYLVPSNHEGVDLHHPLPWRNSRASRSTGIQLLADGQCLFTGQRQDCHQGQLAIFRHLQPDGAEVLSLYGHLSSLGDLKVGSLYPLGYRVGEVNNQAAACGNFLHYAIAYGAAWEGNFRRNPDVPLGAGPTYIRERYLDPLEYLKQKL